jgi:hypothetical protein
MRRSCSKRRLKAAAPRRRRLRCVAFCAHVRYRDPSTVEANRADCNGRSPHMRTRVPPAINLPLCAVRGRILGVPDSRALFARAVGAWASGGRETRRVRSTLPAYLPRARAAGRPKNFYQKKMNTGVSAGTAITTTDGRRSKARRRPNEAADPGANAKTRTVYYSLRPRWRARAGRCTGRPQGMPQGMPQGNGRTKSYSERACSIVLGMGAMFCMHGPAGDHGGWALVLVSFSSCSSSSTRP